MEASLFEQVNTGRIDTRKSNTIESIKMKLAKDLFTTHTHTHTHTHTPQKFQEKKFATLVKSTSNFDMT